jgi:hypothetical protein
VTNIRGSETPRLWTPPLRELTPETSWGFDFIDFCAAIGWELDPWQQWLAKHVGEMLEDGRPRFRTVLIIIARQNGKTVFARLLTLFWMYVLNVGNIVATNTNRGYAKKSWEQTRAMAKASSELQDMQLPEELRLTTGEEAWNVGTSSYMFAAANGAAGRSLTVARALLDEVRELKNFEAWDALTNATNAVRGAQVFAISNQGDAMSVVLDFLREGALSYLDTGQGDERTGIFEWSSPTGSSPTDLRALAMSNPDLGGRIDPDVLLGAAKKAVAAGGEALTGFLTEIMCHRVDLLDAAIEPEHWRKCVTLNPIDLAEHRRKTALCFDVALDGSHATLVAAARIDGRVHVEVVESWQGAGCASSMRRELPALVARIRPSVVAWFPNGPAAAVAAEVRTAGGTRTWPRGVKLEELNGETTAVCMGLAEQVDALEVVHPDDPVLNAHVRATQKLRRGDAWVFTRRGSEPVDGSYALAGAVHAARSMKVLPPLATA